MDVCRSVVSDERGETDGLPSRSVHDRRYCGKQSALVFSCGGDRDGTCRGTARLCRLCADSGNSQPADNANQGTADSTGKDGSERAGPVLGDAKPAAHRLCCPIGCPRLHILDRWILAFVSTRTASW